MEGSKNFVWGERALKGFIDRTTTYRLMFYYLLLLFVAAVSLGAAGVLPYAPAALVSSLVVLAVSAWLVNTLLARVLGAATNLESIFITALILALVLPPVLPTDIAGSLTLAGIAAAAAASKYVFALWKRHIFNPAALAIALAAFLFGVPATWWVAGNLVLLPFIIVGGLIVVYKLRKSDLALAFGIAALVTIVLVSPDPLAGIQATLQYSAIFFFAFVMLTEPITTPPARASRVAYGALVGALFIGAPHIGSLYFSPELSLLVGNLFAFLVSPKGRYALTLVSRRPLARGIYEYLFHSDRPLRFMPGQYLEWTLGSVPLDARGNRRYFTIASAPEEATLALGVRFYDKPSAFKRTLARLPEGAIVSASSLAGDFTLPRDRGKKLAFLAGGIGVTPFVSMARHMLKAGEKRDAILLYSAKSEDEVAYRDVFTDAAREGLRTIYIVSEIIDADRIRREIPDYLERLFYVSGPPGMVDAMKRTLLTLGVSRSAIKTDFFPGLA